MNMHPHGNGCGHSCCLRIQDLHVKKDNQDILTNINLHVHCGELIALIGPNGAGKSTLLKTILGQEDHTGVISFSVPGQRNRKAKIGYVPQSPTFDPGDPMSVADLFACCMGKMPVFLGISPRMRQKITACLSRVHGENLIDKTVGTLSGGELQRVLLALALEPLPNILILDEPLSGVDMEGISSLMDMLDEIRKEYDLSILMTTHDFSSLSRYADQVVLIDKEILCRGSADEVLSSSAFARVFHRNGGVK